MHGASVAVELERELTKQTMKFFSSMKLKVRSVRRRPRRPILTAPEQDDFDHPTVTVTERQHHAGVARQEIDPGAQLSFLYALARRWAWQAVFFRCETHPHEVHLKEQDSNGDTILHWACFGSPPLFVVEAILRVCPELATIVNHNGLLPLHTACSYRAASPVIKALVKAYPQSAGMKVKPLGDKEGGSTPLHLLCDYGCQIESLRAIVETESGSASSRCKDRIYRRTPLQILNERKNMSEFQSHLNELRMLKRRDALRVLDNRQSMEILLLLERIRSAGFWDKAQLLALSEFTQEPVASVEPDRTTVIHALLGLKTCLPPLLEMACFLASHELQRADENGDLPLHLAAREASDEKISDILSAYPEAARTADASGRLPVQIYLDRHPSTSWNRVIHQLIVADPLAIQHMDIDRSLYPLIWSRLTGFTLKMKGGEDTDALFLFIQGNPSCFCE